MPAEDGHNLFFVSDAVKGGAAKYEAKYEITRRVGTQGSLDMARGMDWPADKTPKVEGASSDAAITKLAQGLGADEVKPHGLLVAAIGEVMKFEVAEDGSDSAVSVAGGTKASTFGVSSLMAELLGVRGVPSKVMQGLHRSKLVGDVKHAHAWVEVKLPGLSWVPADPAMRRRHRGGEEDPSFLGTLPADRVTFVIGDEVTLPEDGTLPRTALTGSLVAPFAILEGKRVGKVSWTAQLTPIAAPAQ